MRSPGGLSWYRDCDLPSLASCVIASLGAGRQEWNVRPAQPVVQGVMTTQFYITVSAGRFCGQNYLAALDTCPATSTVLPTAADGLNLTGPAITPDQLQVCCSQQLLTLVQGTRHAAR